MLVYKLERERPAYTLQVLDALTRRIIASAHLICHTGGCRRYSSYADAVYQRQVCKQKESEKYYYFKTSFGRYLRMTEFHSARDIPLLAMRKAAGSGSGPRSISYNEAERSLIAFSDADGGMVAPFA